MSSPSAAQVVRLLQVIELLRPDILLWLGAGLFGILIASLFYGANLTQLYIYATAKRRDPTWVVLLVGWIFCLDTVHTGFIWTWLFEKTVLDAADITKTLLVFEINDALAFSVLLSGAIGASVQSFYAYRIARLARHSWFSILPWVGCLARVALGVVVAITARKAKTLDVFLADYLWTLQGILAVGVGVDIYNTVVVCILLARQRDGMEITSTMISKLSLWTIETGSLTSACAAVLLVLVLVGKTTVAPALMHVYSKLFTFSLLVTLNGRDRLRRILANSAGVVTPFSTSRPTGATSAPMSPMTPQPEGKELGFELATRPYRHHHRTPDSTYSPTFVTMGLAHGDVQSFERAREEDLKASAVAPWEVHEPMRKLRPMYHGDMV